MSPKDHANTTAETGICPSTTHVTRGALTGSRKVYIGEHSVPMREIMLDDPDQPSITVYDTSGPYTDDSVELDIMKGLPTRRKNWIMQRGDVEEVEGRKIEHRRSPRKAPQNQGRHLARTLPRLPRKTVKSQSRRKCHANALRPQRDHHPRNGIHRHSRKPSPHRGL